MAWTSYDNYQSRDGQTGRSAGKPTSLLGRAGRDHRGLFAAGAAALVLAITALPWYTWSFTEAAIKHFTIWSTQYSGWYLAIPIVAVVGIFVGLLNFFLRPGDPGALPVFILLRALALGLVALIALAMYFRTPSKVPGGGMALSVGLRWPMMVALGLALVMVAASVASGLRKGPE